MSVVERAASVSRGGAGDAAARVRLDVRAADEAVHVAAARLLADAREARSLPLDAEAESALRHIEEALRFLDGSGNVHEGEQSGDSLPAPAPVPALRTPGFARALVGRFVVDSRALLHAIRQNGHRAADMAGLEALCAQEVCLVADALARHADALDAQRL